MYFGSVRFFRHLFLLVLLALILVPTALAFRFGIALSKEHLACSNLAQELEQARQAMGGGDLADSAVDPSLSIDMPIPSAFETESAYEYEEKYPDLYVERTGSYEEDDGTAYLTFDDGPSARTLEILDILAEKEVKATFFLVYNPTDIAQEAMLRMISEGHAIGIHSYSHSYTGIYSSVEAFLDDFYQEWAYVYEVTGVKAKVFRFPGGSINAYNGNVYQEIIGEMIRRGFTYYDWNVASGDAATTPVTKQQLLENVLTQSVGKNRPFVLMHDSASKKTTVAALGDMIESLKENGFRFGPITDTIKPVIMPYRDYEG